MFCFFVCLFWFCWVLTKLQIFFSMILLGFFLVFCLSCLWSYADDFSLRAFEGLRLSESRSWGSCSGYTESVARKTPVFSEPQFLEKGRVIPRNLASTLLAWVLEPETWQCSNKYLPLRISLVQQAPRISWQGLVANTNSTQSTVQQRQVLMKRAAKEREREDSGPTTDDSRSLRQWKSCLLVSP